MASKPRQSRIPKGHVKRFRFADMLKDSFEEEKVKSGGKRPTEIKSSTSSAARKRRRAILSMKEVFAESTRREREPTDHAAEFNLGSTALYTWGTPNTQPIPAVRNQRRHKGLRRSTLKRGKNSAFVKFMFGCGSDHGNDDDDDVISPFRFLDLPLEVRWNIYSYLLIHPEPIDVHSNWRTVHVNLPQDHAILRVSKQIVLEATQFLYEKNIFNAVVYTRRVSLTFRPNPSDNFIKREFLPYLRNVIVDCRFRSSDSQGRDDMVGPIASCLNTLVISGAILDSITLVINSVIEHSTPSVAWAMIQPLVGKPIHEYFKVPSSKLMRVIPKLRCKILNIIVRMQDGKRVLVTLSLKDLPVNQDKGGWFAKDKVAILTARKLARKVKDDLVGLEKRFEDIFQDYQKAIKEGKARLMDERESKADGMKLAFRG